MFDVQATKRHVDATTDADKAQVYVAEIFAGPGFPLSAPTVRVGIDGNWMGAIRGSSYLAFSVPAGEHHICMQWQSVQKSVSRRAAFTSFTAEAGKRYYFRAHVAYNAELDLQSVDPDEGQYLVSFLALSLSRPKKK